MDNSAYETRVNFGQRLEPIGNKIIHGYSQYDGAEFSSYPNALPRTEQPAFYQTYRSLGNDVGKALSQEGALHPILASGQQIVQFSLTFSGLGKRVAAGEYDSQINELVESLAAWGKPVYLRIGYEFNGSWNSYDPASYVKSYQRITNAIRAAGLNKVATVWCFSGAGSKDYMKYYPGDEYVDWWGTDIFAAEAFRSSVQEEFLGAARHHGKPVMIGESTPRGIGVLRGQTSWNEWFAGYFKFMQTHPVIKAFDYINANWPEAGVDTHHPSWVSWGDSQIEDDANVNAHYARALSNPIFLNQPSSVKSFESALAP